MFEILVGALGYFVNLNATKFLISLICVLFSTETCVFWHFALWPGLILMLD